MTDEHGRRREAVTGDLDGLPPVLTADQVAELMQMNTDYVRKLAAKARFPPTGYPEAG